MQDDIRKTKAQLLEEIKQLRGRVLELEEARSASQGLSQLKTPPVGTGHKTILLAEDDATILRILTFLLHSSGYTVITAPNGREALRAFEENASKIDLVMLDVVMPELGGREVMDHILARGYNGPFLFSSGYSEDSIHTDFVIHEGLHLIQKPYGKETLLSAIRELLGEEGQDTAS